MFPVVGGRIVDQMQSNIEALGVQLSDETMDAVEDAAPFDLGFPMDFLSDILSPNSGTTTAARPRT